MRVTHTFAELEISAEAWEEIAALLHAADYHHVFIEGAIDMNGIALVKKGMELRAPIRPSGDFVEAGAP